MSQEHPTIDIVSSTLKNTFSALLQPVSLEITSLLLLQFDDDDDDDADVLAVGICALEFELKLKYFFVNGTQILQSNKVSTYELGVILLTE